MNKVYLKLGIMIVTALTRTLGAVAFMVIPYGALGQTKLIKPIITVVGINKKPADSVYIVIPNSPCDAVQLRLNGKLFSMRNNYKSDTNAQLFRVAQNNTLQIACGTFKTEVMTITNKSRFVYISMDEKSCDLYLSDVRMLWEGWTK